MLQEHMVKAQQTADLLHQDLREALRNSNSVESICILDLLKHLQTVEGKIDVLKGSLEEDNSDD